jgi:hypothetical protein
VIFVDTSFFAALLLPRDANHRRAAQAVEELGQVRLADVLLTTNNVILETITVARYEGSHRTAIRAAELLYSGAMSEIHRTTAQDEGKGLAPLPGDPVVLAVVARAAPEGAVGAVEEDGVEGARVDLHPLELVAHSLEL